MDSRRKSSIAITLGALMLAGCATGSSPEASAPETTPMPSTTGGVTTDLSEELRKFAQASCDRALQEGVTERVDDSGDRLVLVPASFIYNDFSAAVVNDDGGVEPVWSTEVFWSCYEHINFSLSEDAGSVYEIHVSGDLASGTLMSERVFADYGTVVSEYVIKGGVFVEVKTSHPDGESVTVIEYGVPSEQDRDSFRQAIDTFLSSE